MTSKVKFLVVSLLALTVGVIASTPVLAAENNAGSGARRGGNCQGTERGPGIVGKVTAINGTTLTISGGVGLGQTTAGTTYTIDASKATFMKNKVASTLASIAVGDTIKIQGTVSGTSISATSICDGKGEGEGKKFGERGMRFGSSTPQIQGNGQPVIAGSVSAINTSVLTVTTKTGIQYTVDATNAKIFKGQGAIVISSIAVGDEVVVQGVTNGTSVTASSIIDQVKPAVTGTPVKGGSHFGFFGQIGGFFKSIFGF